MPSSRPAASKKAVIVYNTTWYVFRFRIPLISALQSAGYQVHVVAPFDGSEVQLRESGVEVHDWPLSQHGANPFTELKALITVATILNGLSPDVVFSYTVKCNLYVGVVSRIYSAWIFLPSVVGLGRVFDSSGVMKRLISLLYRVAFARAKAVFFQNREDREAFEKSRIIDSQQGVVTPGSGIDLLSMKGSGTTPHEDATTVFFMCGRLIPAKGFDLFLEVAERIREKYGERAVFLIAGGKDGESSQAQGLYSRVVAAHERGTVRYLGHTDKIPELLEQCSAVVLPSTYNEGVPRSLIEGLAYGKPIITTDWKGCRETILSGEENGFLIAPRCAASLQKAIEAFLSLSSAARHEMGKASRQLAEQRFDERVVIAMYMEHVPK